MTTEKRAAALVKAAAEKAANEARDAAANARHRYDDQVRAATQEARERILKSFAALNDEVTKLQIAANQAEIALAKAAEAFGRAEYADKIGVRMVEWGRWSRYNEEAGLVPTGRLGVLEVWGEGSQYPDNFARYSIPSAGKLILRFLNKDGSPSKRFIDSLWQIENRWRPDGVQHENARKVKT
jgi:hypothetical protein